jgi:hypothetical protein
VVASADIPKLGYQRTYFELMEDIVDVRFQSIAGYGCVAARLKSKASPNAQNRTKSHVLAPVEILIET